MQTSSDSFSGDKGLEKYTKEEVELLLANQFQIEREKRKVGDARYKTRITLRRRKTTSIRGFPSGTVLDGLANLARFHRRTSASGVHCCR